MCIDFSLSASREGSHTLLAKRLDNKRWAEWRALDPTKHQLVLVYLAGIGCLPRGALPTSAHLPYHAFRTQCDACDKAG